MESWHDELQRKDFQDLSTILVTTYGVVVDSSVPIALRAGLPREDEKAMGERGRRTARSSMTIFRELPVTFRICGNYSFVILTGKHRFDV